GEIVDDFDDLADIVGALAEGSNDLTGRIDRSVNAVEAVGGLVHGADTVVNFFAGPVGNVEQHFRGVSDALNRGDHLVDRGGGFADARSLHLRAFHHVLHVDTHLVHGAGDFVDRRGSLQTDLGGIVGGSRNLVGSARNLRR